METMKGHKMTRIPGPGAKRTIKDVVDGMNAISKVIRGEKVAVKKKRAAPVRTKPRNDMIEKELERQIINTLRTMAYWAYKTAETAMYNSRYCEDGSGDITVKGRPFKIMYIEVKVKGRKQRTTQIEAQKRCEQQGIGYYLVRSVREAIEAVKKESII
jgi:hypothetical protein